MNSFQKEGVLQRLAQLDNDLLALYGVYRRFEITITGGNIDVDKLKDIIDDVTELRVNLDDEEWLAFQGNVNKLLYGELL